MGLKEIWNSTCNSIVTVFTTTDKAISLVEDVVNAAKKQTEYLVEVSVQDIDERRLEHQARIDKFKAKQKAYRLENKDLFDNKEDD
jgi:hypothetical protein